MNTDLPDTPAADEKPRRRARRLLRPALAGLFVLALLASAAGNVLLYREAKVNYRRLAEAQLDPLGLKHADFPPDVAVPDAGGGAAAGDLPVALFFGDSRARGWPAPHVPGWRFVNRGIGGQTTEQILGRFGAHVAPLAPRVVVVQAGINDLKAIGLLPDRRDAIVADCKTNLREVVKRSAAGGAVVILTTIFPPGHVPIERRMVWSPRIEEAVEEVNADLRTLASDKVIVLDAWKVLQDHGRLREGYGADTLHLSARAYQVLNDELVKVLDAAGRRSGLPPKPSDVPGLEAG